MAVAIAVCLLVPIRVQAGDLSGEVSLASQLVDRGLAITPATPALQGAVAWTTTSGWSLGLSGGVDLRSPGHVAAILARVAHSWALSGNWRMQTSVLYYHYDGLRHVKVYEPGVYLSYRDVLTFGMSGMHVVGGRGRWLYPAADLNFHWPLASGLSVTAGIGVAHYAMRYGYPGWRYPLGYYRYGQVGVLWSHNAWRVELDRVAVDPHARRYFHGLVATSWLATISRSF